jgi:uncharacterized protein (TIGR03067 family)
MCIFHDHAASFRIDHGILFQATISIMKMLFLIPFAIAALFESGCSTPSQSNPPPAPSESAAPAKTMATAFEGSWKGRDVTPGNEGTVSLIVSGQNLEFHGSQPDDWLKGTFTLHEDANPKQLVGVVTDCASADNVGKKIHAIYKIEDGTMTISGSGLDDPNFPSSFDAPGTRQLVFKHTQ